jgi:hypothetical protein
MLNKLLIIAISVVLIGCAQNTWYKPTARSGEFESDRYECIQQSQQRLSVASIYKFSGTAVDQQITNDQVFSTCMTSKGWSLGKKEDVQNQVAQSTAQFNSVKFQLDQLTERSKVFCSLPEFKEFYTNTPCLVTEMSLTHTANDSKITDELKKVMLKQQEYVAGFRKEWSELVKSIGPNGVRQVEINQNIIVPMIEKNTLNLYTGKISWGEYNQRRKEISREEEAAYKGKR